MLVDDGGRTGRQVVDAGCSPPGFQMLGGGSSSQPEDGIGDSDIGMNLDGVDGGESTATFDGCGDVAATGENGGSFGFGGSKVSSFRTNSSSDSENTGFGFGGTEGFVAGFGGGGGGTRTFSSFVGARSTVSGDIGDSTGGSSA